MKSEKLPASSKQQRGEQFKIQNYPNFNEEQKLWRKGLRAVVGLDEAGRGPLAGPVIAAAICLASAKFKVQSSKFKMSVQNSKFLEIRDSKKLTARQRDEWYKILTVNPDIKWGIGVVSEKIIDRINIFEDTKLAMMRAIKNLRIEPEFILLDGNFILEDLYVSQKEVMRGDERIFSCAAASIIAKVTRDRLVCRLSRTYPAYGF